MIHRHHYQEFQESAIAPEVIELNFLSLSGTSPYEYLLYSDELPRRNTGRLSDGYLKRYEHLEEGGWYCGTIDPLSGSESLWGCFKPDKPRIDPETRKPIKYEHPPLVQTEAFFLKVTWGIGLKIATNCGLEESYKERMATLIGMATIETFLKTEDTGFWQWVIKNPKIRIQITEGAKKTASLLSAGYCTIGLPGIWGGYRLEKDDVGNVIGLPYLIPQLVPFATQRREINFCFDNDPKPKTKQAVRQATLKTGNLFKFKGCSVKVILWDSSDKGVDDLIVSKGLSYFDAVYNARNPLELFELEGFKTLSPDLKINQRYLDLTIPSEAKIIGIKSAKGTGKTELLTKIVEKAIANGQPCLVIGHRVKLLEELAHRFGVPYRLEVRKSELGTILGYCLCIDSLHEYANPSFKPSAWEGALVIIDEAEQVLWHLLNSPTCQNNRVSIIETFSSLLRTVVATGGKVYLADADLTRISIDYVKQAIGFPVNTWIVENTYLSSLGRKLFSYNSSSALNQAILTEIKNGGKPFIFTGAKDVQSKLAAQARILVLDSDTCKDPSHPAYKAISNLNQVLNDYDVVIATPVIETGMSITLKNHFTGVFAFGTGKQTVNGFCQGLDRLRDDVPRHIWAVKHSTEKIGNGETNYKRLLRSEHQKFKVVYHFLSVADQISSLDDFQPENLNTWGKMACFQNYEAKNYREIILQKLESEGYSYAVSLPPIAHYVTEEDSKLLLGLAREENYENECDSVTASVNPTDQEFQLLEKENDKTPSQRYTHRKGKLCRRYLTSEITSEMVKRDDDGWFKQLTLHYYLTTGKEFLIHRDQKRVEGLASKNGGKVFKPDVNKIALTPKIKVLEFLQIERFLNPESLHDNDSLADWFKNIIVPHAHAIKTVLGLTINPLKDSPVAVAQRLLGRLGLKLTCIGRLGSRGNRKRVYQLLDPNLDGRNEIFSRWSERDSKPVSTLSNNSYLLEEVAA
jgi:Domain of unknown function (DUF3854)